MVATPDIVVSYSIKALRERAGLSMREMAEIMGLKSASSYQNYENPDKFKKDFIPPDKIELLVKGLVGKGDPPITESDVRLLGHLTLLEAKTVQSQNQLARETVDDLLSIKGLGRRLAEPPRDLLRDIQRELADMRDECAVMVAILNRLDASVNSLSAELRAMRSQFNRLRNDIRERLSQTEP